MVDSRSLFGPPSSVGADPSGPEDATSSEESIDELRARADDAISVQRRLAFGYQATETLLGQRRGPREVARTLTQICVPDLADWAIVTLGKECVAAAHFDPAKETIAATLIGSALRLGDGAMQVLETGKSELMTQVPRGLLEGSETPLNEHLTLLAVLGARSYIVVPLEASGVIRGMLLLVAAESDRRYGHDDLAFVEDLASRAALVIENARVLEAERVAREHAELATRTRDDLLAIVSHDLRSPLSVIAQAASMVKNAVDPSQHRRIDMILRASDQMTRLIADLLDFAALQTGGLTVERDRHDVRALVQEAGDAFVTVAAAKNIELIADAEPSELVVLCDRERVAQVIGNLVGNAIKFTQDGGRVTIGARRVDLGAEIAVIDTGPGIPAPDLPHIFDRYWQARRTARRGVGLGLSISKGLVEAQGGRIWAESQLGKGTAFRFVLPFAR
jgi:signal transduction histidine kinase